MALARPDWHRYGDDFTFVWPDAGVGLAVERIRESSSGEMHAEVTAQTLTGGHLHMARLNLWSTTGRQALVRQLGATYEGPPWAGIVEQMCAITVREWRHREPVINLRTHTPGERARVLMAGLLRQGEPTIVFADGGSGKSMLALGIAASFATGVPLARGMEPAARMTTLYLDWETTPDTAHERYEAVCMGLGAEEWPDLYYRRLFRPLVDEIRSVRAEVARLGVGLVVLDSLGPASGDLESPTAAVAAMGAMRQLEGVTTLTLAHLSKAGAAQANGRARVYGSVFFENLARRVVELRRSEDSGLERDEIDVMLTTTKVNEGRRGQPWGLHIAFEMDDRDTLCAVRFGRQDVAEVPDLYDRMSLSYRVRRELTRQRMTVAELVEATNPPGETARRKESAVRTTLHRLRQKGAVVCDEGHVQGGRGVVTTWWAPVAEG